MIHIIRILRGYIVIAINGSCPEKFLNVLTVNGISVWGVRSDGGVVYCKTAVENYRYIYRLSRKRSIRIHTVQKRGLPFIVHRNRKRVGLLIGAACFVLVFGFLSDFLWSVDIYGFENMSYTNAKTVMESVGVYEGASAKFDSLRNVQTKALIELGSASWITVNVDGSHAEVNITETTSKGETEDGKHYNITAGCDGQIIRADAYRGMSYIQSGDAVVKGSLLIGGFVQTELGSTILDTAQGTVIAKTEHTESISVPKTYSAYSCEYSGDVRYNARLFGLNVPLTMCAVLPNEKKIGVTDEYTLSFGDKTAPVSLINEQVYYVEENLYENDDESADELFTADMMLSELFGYADKKIISRNISRSADDKNYNYIIEYVCEEDIGVRTEILFDDNFSYDGTFLTDDAEAAAPQ